MFSLQKKIWKRNYEISIRSSQFKQARSYVFVRNTSFLGFHCRNMGFWFAISISQVRNFAWHRCRPYFSHSLSTLPNVGWMNFIVVSHLTSDSMISYAAWQQLVISTADAWLNMRCPFVDIWFFWRIFRKGDALRNICILLVTHLLVFDSFFFQNGWKPVKKQS